LLAGTRRLAGGHAAALIFLFLTALLCLATSLLSLQMWRREVAQKHREPPPARARHVSFKDEVVPPGRPPGRPRGRVLPAEEGEKP
ncbi:MALD2 protein, partial [Oceanites oceanicus]|nr:MALD2 protein [Oceanites oceanicus]